jgi:hypothetical protein
MDEGPTPTEHRRSPEADWLAIAKLTHDYCWAIDTRQWDALHDVFDAEVEADLGAGAMRGVDAVIARVSSVLGGLDASQHMVSTHQISVDGDVATGRCSVLAQHVRRGTEGGSTLLFGGWYEDEYRVGARGWRITKRRIVASWSDGNRAVISPPTPRA